MDTRTLRNVLVRQPHRLVTVGKFLGLLSYVVVAATVAFIVGIIAGLIVAPGHGVNTTAWTSTSGLSNLLSMYGDLMFAVVGYSVLGYFSAILFLGGGSYRDSPGVHYRRGESPGGRLDRRASVAVWQLVGSVINGESLLHIDTGKMASFDRGILLGAGYMLVFAIATGVLFRLRDVTS